MPRSSEQEQRFADRLSKLKQKFQNMRWMQGKSEKELLAELLFREWQQADNADEGLGSLLDVVAAKPNTSKEITKEEKQRAASDLAFIRQRFMKYQDEFELNGSTDIGDLRNIIYYEMLVRSIQMSITGDFDKYNKSKIDALNDANKALLDLKSKLGITKGQRQKKGESAFQNWARIKQDAKDYMLKHRDEFMWKCKSCGTFHFMLRRHTAFDEYGVIWNQQIIDYVNEGVLTLRQAAKILEVSPMYLQDVCKKKNISLKVKDDA